MDIELLNQLEADVQGDAVIHDEHPRFFEHCDLMASIGELFPDLDARMETIGAADTASENAIAREGIARLRARLA